MGLVVFDFDKTLTDRDTLFGFYREANRPGLLFKFKQAILIAVAIAMKLGIAGNDRLKKVGVTLFLKGKSEEKLNFAARAYAKSIALNRLYESDYKPIKMTDRMIVSASFSVYLKALFPDENIIASTLTFKNGKVSGLKENVYGLRKKELLREMGIEHIDCFYTDSYSDKPLMDMSREVYLVRDGKKEKIK